MDVYGKVRKGDNSFVPFLYQGQYYDEETDLAYNRFRYYSPDSGTYISQDPIGLLGSNPNFYAYTKDTNTWVDPFGLDCLKNKTDGLAREKKVQGKLEGMFGKDKVLRERTLKDLNGKKVVGPDGTGRRVDFVVLDDAGNAKYVVEVTSETANKTAQEAKELFIYRNKIKLNER